MEVAESAEVGETGTDLVLIVDDDPALRSALSGVLDMHGMKTIEADSRKNAVQVLESEAAVAVVILDLGMPPAIHGTEEGLGVIRAASAALHPAKIIVLTGQDHEQSALEAIREGAFDFLSKPASIDDILQAVRRAQLFFRKEKMMAAEGTTRLQLNAKISDGLKAVREEAEEKLVRQVLKDTGFNVYASAAKLGLKRESIYYFLKKFEIKRDDK
jgi:DNA-binding NtrC family response regulator